MWNCQSKLAADVVVESLVEARPADVCTELQRVIAFHPSQIVSPHERIADLRQFAFPSIADREAT